MNKSEFSLTHAPIVEAVLDIECDLPAGQQLAALEGPARERFGDRYPRFRTQYFQEHQVETKPDSPPNLSTRHGVIAFQLLQEDEKQLVQVRVQGFSFNRLAPYTSLDDYLPEIEQSWRQYVALATPHQVRRIRLRYINRILLPLVDGRVDLSTYFNDFPRLPDEERLTLVSFLHQHAAMEVATGNQVHIVLTSQRPECDEVAIIFDNGVAAEETGEPDDWAWILSKIQALRILKNDMLGGV